jgi:hypothetical protein
MPAGLWQDGCYRGGVALIAHDWSYGATFYRLHVGQSFIFGGVEHIVTEVQITTPAQQFGVFNWRVALVLMTCSGSNRLLVSAS